MALIKTSTACSAYHKIKSKLTPTWIYICISNRHEAISMLKDITVRQSMNCKFFARIFLIKRAHIQTHMRSFLSIEIYKICAAQFIYQEAINSLKWHVKWNRKCQWSACEVVFGLSPHVGGMYLPKKWFTYEILRQYKFTLFFCENIKLKRQR